jgi:hypothetical protein
VFAGGREVAVLEFGVGLDGYVLIIEVGKVRHEVLYDAHGARMGWHEKREGKRRNMGEVVNVGVF